MSNSDAAWRGSPFVALLSLSGYRFLLNTQLDDGSWHVVSRSVKFQPYFDGGFPHDRDQWSSATGSAWATMALAPAAGSPEIVAWR